MFKGHGGPWVVACVLQIARGGEGEDKVSERGVGVPCGWGWTFCFVELNGG